MLKKSIYVCILLSLIGCSGTGFERKTAMLPDEIYVASKIEDPEDGDWNIGPEWTIGFKWKFK